MPTHNLVLPRPHIAQQRVLSEVRRFNCLCMGRRWGKDVFLTDRVVRPALEGYPTAWINPSYPMLTETWREMRYLLQPVAKRIDSQQHRIELITGGLIDFWSLDAFDTIRGRKYKRVIINEASLARYLKEAWENAIRPTLSDMEGDAYFGFTPKGRNYAWELHTRGAQVEGQEDAWPEWMSWQMPTSTNPFIPPAEIEAARKELPELVYQQEYLAQFIEGSGVVFRRLRDCVPEGQEWPIEPYPGNFVGGLDFGQKHDYTVLVVMDAATRRVVAIDRFNKIDWAYQRERIKAMYHAWNIGVIVAESNSIGQPNIEALVEDNIAIQPFVTTNATKSRIIQRLVMDIENRNIVLPPDQNLLSELEAFEQEQTPTGLMKYSAPEGGYDDCVMALALCNDGAQTGGFIS